MDIEYCRAGILEAIEYSPYLMKIACIYNHIHIVKHFSENLNAIDLINSTHYRIIHRHGNSLHLFETDEFIEELDDISIIDTCCKYGRIHILAYLCDKFDMTNYITYGSNHILRGCCYYGQLSVLLFLSTRYNITMSGDEAYRALRVSVKNKYLNISTYLCEHYPITKQNIIDDNCMPLISACKNGTCDILKYLCHKYDFTSDDILSHNIILHYACAKGCVEIIKFLVEKYDITAEYINNSSDFDNIIVNGHYDAVIYLLSISNIDAKQILRECCELGHLRIVKYICENNDFNVDLA